MRPSLITNALKYWPSSVKSNRSNITHLVNPVITGRLCRNVSFRFRARIEYREVDGCDMPERRDFLPHHHFKLHNHEVIITRRKA